MTSSRNDDDVEAKRRRPTILSAIHSTNCSLELLARKEKEIVRLTFDDFNFVSVESSSRFAFSHAGAVSQNVDVREDFADEFSDEF